MTQLSPLQSSSILCIAMVLGLAILAVVSQRRAWLRIVLITLISTTLLIVLNDIYLAGVHAAQFGVRMGIANESYIKGTLKTMESITPSRVIVFFGILYLTGFALFQPVPRPSVQKKDA